ncbi:MAG: hypothetical protein WA705_25765 [Candidatus Ozemobacteraceae bacterium]
MNKKELSERDICTKFINPAIEKAGWDLVTQIDGHVMREDFSKLCSDSFIADITMQTVIANSLKTLWENVLNHALLSPAVEKSRPIALAATRATGAIIGAQRHEMPTLEWGISSVPLTKMCHQSLSVFLHEPPKPSSGRDCVEGLVQKTLVDVMGLSKIQQAVAVQEAGHGRSPLRIWRKQPPLNIAILHVGNFNPGKTC